MLRILRERHHIREIFIQDPEFVKNDKLFLQSHGFTVLEHPAACDKMSTSTFLFAPYLGYHVLTQALQVAFPALYIGNAPQAYLENMVFHPRGLEEQTPQIQRMAVILRQFRDSSIDGEPLPDFDGQRWAQNTTIHWLAADLGESAKGNRALKG